MALNKYELHENTGSMKQKRSCETVTFPNSCFPKIQNTLCEY